MILGGALLDVGQHLRLEPHRHHFAESAPCRSPIRFGVDCDCGSGCGLRLGFRFRLGFGSSTTTATTSAATGAASCPVVFSPRSFLRRHAFLDFFFPPAMVPLRASCVAHLSSDEIRVSARARSM